MPQEASFTAEIVRVDPQAFDATLRRICKKGDANSLRQLIGIAVANDMVGALDTERFGDPAIVWAAAHGQAECARALLPYVESPDSIASALATAAGYGQDGCLAVLIGAGARLENETSQRLRAIHHAASAGQVDCLEILIEAGADVNASAIGRTPLMEAVVGSDMGEPGTEVDCVRALLKAGARVDQPDFLGRTAAMHAAIEKKDDCLRLLIEAGADLELVDAKGRTAESHAAEWEQEWGDGACAGMIRQALAVKAEREAIASAARPGKPARRNVLSL